MLDMWIPFKMDTSGIVWLFSCFLLSLFLILLAEHADSPAHDLPTRPNIPTRPVIARGPRSAGFSAGV